MAPNKGATPLCFSVLKPDHGAAEVIERDIILEAPIAIEYNGIGYAVMMATPIDLEDYAVGFSMSEGLVSHTDDILAIDAHKADLGWILRIQVPQENAAKVFARARQRVSEREYNALSVRLELQADCFAGVWANHAQSARQILEQGDVEEAMNAAAKIGDDALQGAGGGRVVPESFTHGTSAQRQHWFDSGLKNGTLKACDTFSARGL